MLAAPIFPGVDVGHTVMSAPALDTGSGFTVIAIVSFAVQPILLTVTIYCVVTGLLPVLDVVNTGLLTFALLKPVVGLQLYV